MTVQQANRNNDAQLAVAKAALVFAQQQAARYEDLAHTGYGSVQNASSLFRSCISRSSRVQAAVEILNLAHRQVESLKARMSAAKVRANRAQLHLAQVNLERTRILSPANGYVTNLLAHLGDFVDAGVKTISVVDADSYWVDGYFEETNIAPIRVGDAAKITLMGYSEVLRGHVDSIARANNVSNAQPDNQGVATVNPIFTWVRLSGESRSDPHR